MSVTEINVRLRVAVSDVCTAADACSWLNSGSPKPIICSRLFEPGGNCLSVRSAAADGPNDSATVRCSPFSLVRNHAPEAPGAIFRIRFVDRARTSAVPPLPSLMRARLTKASTSPAAPTPGCGDAPCGSGAGCVRARRVQRSGRPHAS